jgi:hypothetical protein
MIEGRTYQKGTRKRTVIGFEGYFVIYRTHSTKPRTVGEAIWTAKKWFDKAVEVHG